MNTHMIKILVLNEVRLRMRRLSTLVALLAVVAISWAMIPDPRSGTAFMAVDNARILYTSAALSLGSAMLGGLLFGLGGFYLVRGRIGEDIRSGTGSVIAATGVGNVLFLFSRWLGGVVYLVGLIIAFMGAILVCHALRGDGPIEPLVYLQTYAMLLLPMAFFAASCAILFDSFGPLMGKGGDILYFVWWSAQLSLAPLAALHKLPSDTWLLFDFNGMAMAWASLGAHFDLANMSVGASEFDPALATVTLPAAFWSTRVILMRCASALVALLVLLPASFLFHRFSPDRVKLAAASKRRSPLALINQWLRPLSRLVQPLFRLAAALPGFWGQVVADVALTLAASPAAIAALIVAFGASLLVTSPVLGPLTMVCVAFWGVLVADLCTRDYQAGIEDMTGALRGGIAQRYGRQLAATGLLGFLFMAVIAVRWAIHEPLRAGALVVGIVSLSALASLFGRCSRTPRLFMGLFLFGLYVAVNAITVPMIDIVGFNGVANTGTVLTQLAIAITAALAGYAYNGRRV